MTTPNALGRYLKRKSRTLADLARAVDANPSQISRIVSGKCGPSIPLAVAIEKETGGAVPVTTWAKRSRRSNAA
jgi:transcriptional regulator with XRE-family HTH domain